jgi:hypothetical protein
MKSKGVKQKMCRECCCGPPHDKQGHGHHRRFLTKAERVEKLKGYAEELRSELKAVEENISQLES